MLLFQSVVIYTNSCTCSTQFNVKCHKLAVSLIIRSATAIATGLWTPNNVKTNRVLELWIQSRHLKHTKQPPLKCVARTACVLGSNGIRRYYRGAVDPGRNLRWPNCLRKAEATLACPCKWMAKHSYLDEITTLQMPTFACTNDHSEEHANQDMLGCGFWHKVDFSRRTFAVYTTNTKCFISNRLHPYTHFAVLTWIRSGVELLIITPPHPYTYKWRTRAPEEWRFVLRRKSPPLTNENVIQKEFC